MLKDIENEIRAVETITGSGGHPNVIRTLAHGWLEPPHYYYFDMELCAFNLDDYIRGKTVQDEGEAPNTVNDSVFVRNDTTLWKRMKNVWTIGKQIAAGLEFMHSLGQVHGDLKPRNSKHLPLDSVDMQYCILSKAMIGRLLTSARQYKLKIAYH